MHIKTFVASIFLIIILCPVVLGNLQTSLHDEKETSPIATDQYIGVLYAKGAITDLCEMKCGYATMGWEFNAVDVICILSLRDRPVFHRFTDNEQLCIGPVFYGSISESAIRAWEPLLIWPESPLWYLLVDIMLDIMFVLVDIMDEIIIH